MSGVIERIGGYRLLNSVSVGQYSRFWEAVDDTTRVHYGVKVLLPQFEKDSNQIGALRWEYNTAHSFNHPNVIKILQFERDRSGLHYLVMEWFAAPNLKILLNRGYTTYAERLSTLMQDMAMSLDYLHSRGWVHRDVKPDNFLFDDASTLKLIDFGMSRKTKSGIAKMFHVRTKPQGTASYLAPEQIRGEAPSPSVDIYSLGCTFFELATGRPPFAANSMTELLQKHISAPPPPALLRNRNLTPEFSRLIQGLMAKRRDERPSSARDVAAALKTTPIFRKQPTAEDIV
ncbi:MAG: serine/threonine protein kinase [Thermoguttaceae bacterium]